MKTYTVNIKYENNHFVAHSKDFGFPAYAQTPAKAVANLSNTIVMYNRVVNDLHGIINDMIDDRLINGDIA